MLFLERVNEALLAIGLNFPDMILLMIILSSFIVFALDSRIGLMFLNVALAFSLVFMALIGQETGKILITFFISIVLTTLSLYFVSRKGVF